MVASGRLCVLVASLALGSAACVEAGTYERTASQLEEARRAAVQREMEIRALRWQISALGQEISEAQQRDDASQRELHAQVQQLTATNATLAERLKKSESDHAALLLAASAESAATGRHDPRADDLRRRMALAEARSAAILDELGRIERILTQPHLRPTIQPAAAETALPRATSAAGDTIDPWGGSRR